MALKTESLVKAYGRRRVVDGVSIHVDPGEIVALQLELPGTDAAIEAAASVVWVHDDQDDPGPRRMALKFTEFLKPSDRNRLVDYIDRERGRRAA